MAIQPRRFDHVYLDDQKDSFDFSSLPLPKSANVLPNPYRDLSFENISPASARWAQQKETSSLTTEHSRIAHEGTTQPPVPPQTGILNCFGGFQFIQPYFDVTTVTVLDRLKTVFFLSSSLSRKPQSQFIEETDILSSPDLYGPVWITITLVFAFGLSATFVSYLNSFINNKLEYATDLRSVSTGFILLTVTLFLVPFILYILLIYQGASIGYIRILSLFGYSLAAFIPSVLISCFGSNMLTWFVLSLSTMTAASFVMKQMRVELRKSMPRRQRGIIWFVIIVINILLFVSIKTLVLTSANIFIDGNSVDKVSNNEPPVIDTLPEDSTIKIVSQPINEILSPVTEEVKMDGPQTDTASQK